MSKHVKYTPKHRQSTARRAPRQAVRTVLVLSTLAVTGTATAVAAGALTLEPGDTGTDAAPAAAPALAAAAVRGTATTAGTTGTGTGSATGVESDGAGGSDDADDPTAVGVERRAVVSRSDRRGTADPAKQAALSLDAGASQDNAMTRSEDASDEDPRSIARLLVGDETQFECLDSLWTKESGWRVDADNPSSSAYGIPQALPGSKMSSFGADWATNPVTQIRWGLDYIEARYGSPCGAWSHSQAYNFY